MKKKVFFVDICNTLADVNGQLTQRGFQTSVYPSPVPPEIFMDEALYRQANPIWPIVKLVKKLAQHYSIVYLTARREEMREVTLEWLIAYSLLAGPLVHTNERLKGEVILELVSPEWIGGAVEDSPQEIEGYTRAVPGIKLLIPEWPHNKETLGIHIPLYNETLNQKRGSCSK